MADHIPSGLRRLFLPALGGPGDINRHRFMRPALGVVAGFAAVIVISSGVLMLPFMHDGPRSPSFVETLFTATSAVCVVGLAVVDTGDSWSLVGQVFLLFLMQIGGLGIMTLTALLALLVIGRSGLRTRLRLQQETRAFDTQESTRGIVLRIAKMSLFFEALIAIPMCVRLWVSHQMSFAEGLWVGVFHAVAAFNNAGFSLFSDSLTRFNDDPWILVPAMLGIIVGGVGVPVLLELRRRLLHLRRWGLHTRLTIYTTVFLLIGGIGAITIMEWTNPATLGPMPWQQKLLVGAFHGVTPRSGGLNVIDTGALTDSSLFATMMLMFVGGGSGGTAGGIKVTTFAVLWVVVWTEMRGQPHPHAAGRRITPDVVRQSLALTFLSMTVICLTVVVLLSATRFTLQDVLFEAVSAAGVVGLSTGITHELPSLVQAFLVPIMFVGRLGPITVASALALRTRTRRYELPEGRPVIG